MTIHLIMKAVEQSQRQIFKFVSTIFVILSLFSFSEAEDNIQKTYIAQYENNKKEIFKNVETPFFTDRFVYVVGVSEILDEVIKTDFLNEKSELMAISKIVKNYPFNTVNWPDDYSNNLRIELWKNFLKNTTISKQIDKKQYINIDNGTLSDKDNDYYYVVLVFEKKYLDNLLGISLQEILIRL